MLSLSLARVLAPAALLVPALLAHAARAQVASTPSGAQAREVTRCAVGSVTWNGVALETLCLDVAYGPHDCQRLDLYVPVSNRPCPVLVEIHRGGLHTGQKSDFGNYFQTGGTDGIVEKALRAGIAVASVNYRLTSRTDARCQNVLDGFGQEIPEPAHAFPAANEDVARAVQFVRQAGRAGTWNLDPDRVGCLGGSGGGLLASWLAVAADRRVTGAPSGTLEAESSRVECALVFRGPTDLRTGTNYMCASMTDLLGYFAAPSIAAYNADPLIVELRRQASPTWIAEQPGGSSAGYAANASVSYLGIYAGDPDLTLSDFVPNPPDCSGALDPLWIPTWDLHGLLQGLRMQRTFTLLGNPSAEILIRPTTGACGTWNQYGTDAIVDHLCRAFAHVPHTDLSAIYAGKAGSNGKVPRIAAFGKSLANGQATVWIRDAAPSRPVTLYVSPNSVPSPFQGGTLVPDASTLTFVPLGVTNSCGHARLVLPPNFPKPSYVQAVVDDPGASFGTALSQAIRVD